MSELRENQRKKTNPSTSRSAVHTVPSRNNVSKNFNSDRRNRQGTSASVSSTQEMVDRISSSVNKLSVNCVSNQSVNINSNTELNLGQASSTNNRKNKNAIKKERIKNLHVVMPNGTNLPEAVQTAPPLATQNGVNSVYEAFLKQVAPLYANTSSRYLENLAHHPHLHIAHRMQLRQMYQSHQFAASLPNTSSMQQAHSSNSFNFPQPGQGQPPKFIQNAMQHPLLSKNLLNARFNMQQPGGSHPMIRSNTLPNVQEVRPKNSPRRHKKQTKPDNKENDDKWFESYLTIEEVDEGLKNNTLLEGVLRINPKQFQHAYVSSADRSEQDVLIESVKNRNRALEGDVVVVQYIDSDSDEGTGGGTSETTGEDAVEGTDEFTNEVKQKKGKVVFIKEKVHNRTCIGNLKLMTDKNRQKALFVPRDYRMPRLNIPFTSWPDNFYHDSKAYENTLFLAKIIAWNDIRFAHGKIVCNIGESGDMRTETQAILAQTDLDITPFGPEVKSLYPSKDYTIPEEEIKRREDCRKLCIFSIDPSNCRDIDDAVSCKKLDNGNYEIGVHISDVAHYLTENTVLDEKVAEKATTIYMVERAYHMLPDDLCMLCSLFPGIDKLAFSVFWEITGSGIVISHRFAKTVIHSCCQLSYEHAQAVLAHDENAEETFPEMYNGFNYEDVRNTIKALGKISAMFRNKRFKDGALRIDQPKVSFHLSPTNGLPDSFHIYENKESHQLIEEFMLLANMTVAKRIYDDHPKLAFLRCHPAPSTFMLKDVAKSLKPMGIDLDITSAGTLNKSLSTYTFPGDVEKGKAMVLSMLCAKPMARARYFCVGHPAEDDFKHYALNVPFYTHFTSPIRRYADIMVHRLLAASINFRDAPTWDVDNVCMIAAQCNKQKYNAKKAGELSTELYTLKYIELNSPLSAEAVVVEVRDKYIDVIVVSIGLNRRIYFNNDFPGVFKCIKSDAGRKLSKMEIAWNETDTSPAVTQVIEVFSILQVVLHKGDDMLKVETKLVRPQ